MISWLVPGSSAVVPGTGADLLDLTAPPLYLYLSPAGSEPVRRQRYQW